MAKKELDTINLTTKQLVTLLEGQTVKIGSQPIKVVNLDDDLGALEDLREVVDDLIVEIEEEDDEENFDDDDEDDELEEDLEDEPDEP